MADFDFINWGTTKIVGKWVIEGTPSPSGVYRGQCTQVVSQLLKDLGYADWNVARGNGNQVGATMVARGEAVYVGTNLASIPTNEIHIICKDVGVSGSYGHVSVAAAGDTVYEQNVNNGLPTANFGIGACYSGRIGRLGEAWRGTRYHYKLTIDTIYDNVTGDGGTGEPDDGATGPNQNRYLRKYQIDIKKKNRNFFETARTHKNYDLVKVTKRGIGN